MIPGVTGVAGFTVIGMLLLVAVAGETQVAFEVRITLTTSPFTNPVLLKLGLLVPVLIPFTCHW